MIDLINNDLQSAIVVGGRSFPVYTDFRYWLRFTEIMKELDRYTMEDLLFLFPEEQPLYSDATELISQIILFYLNPNGFPKSADSKDVVMDYKLDSDYIFAGFIQQYGINLLDTKMHWHKFLALQRGLSDDTMLTKIMSWRSYTGKDKEMKRLKRAWALPVRTSMSEEALKKRKEFDDYFEGK